MKAIDGEIVAVHGEDPPDAFSFSNSDERRIREIHRSVGIFDTEHSLHGILTPSQKEKKRNPCVRYDPLPMCRVAQYGRPITYEDPAYVHESELIDVTDEVSRDPQSLSRVLIPKRRTLHFSYSIPSLNPSASERNDGVVDAIANILDSYAASRGADMFAVVEDNGLLDVVPTHFVNAEGRAEQITPLWIQLFQCYRRSVLVRIS